MEITKLPKWAQEHIKGIARQRDAAVRALNEYVDNQTPSPIFVDDYVCTGEGRGSSSKRRYVQGNNLTIEHQGVRLYITLRDRQIDLQWGNGVGIGEVALIPSSFQIARLVSKENMR
jgi:hypothetical protein